MREIIPIFHKFRGYPFFGIAGEVESG